jgi:hypothetical protein
MNRANFTVQVMVVVALVLLVSWPEQRRVRAVSIWRTSADDWRLARGASGAYTSPDVGLHSATALGVPTDAAGSVDDASRRLYDEYLQILRRGAAAAQAADALAARSNGIIGVVRILGTRRPVPNARVVLRHIRTGQIVARTLSNGEGQFSFLGVDPSEYVVEFVDDQGAIVATSGALSIGRSELKETSLQVSPTGTFKLLAQSAQATAPEVVDAASDSGVTQATSPAQTISPRY